MVEDGVRNLHQDAAPFRGRHADSAIRERLALLTGDKIQVIK